MNPSHIITCLKIASGIKLSYDFNVPIIPEAHDPIDMLLLASIDDLIENRILHILKTNLSSSELSVEQQRHLYFRAGMILGKRN